MRIALLCVLCVSVVGCARKGEPPPEAAQEKAVAVPALEVLAENAGGRTVVRVPYTALLTSGRVHKIFRIENEHIVEQEVKLGQRFGDSVEVAPLPAGAVVAISGLRGLHQGDRVQAEMVMALPPLPDAPRTSKTKAADCPKPAQPAASSIPGANPADAAKGCAAPENSLLPAKPSPAAGIVKEK